MADHLHGSRFRDLKKTRRLAAGVGMNVERVECRGRALRREFRRTVRQAAQVVHLLRGQKKRGIGPAFDALLGAHFSKAAAELQNVEFFAVVNLADVGGFRGELFSKIEGGRTRIGDTRGRLLRTAGGAGAQNEAEGQGNAVRGASSVVRDEPRTPNYEPVLQPIPKSSTRSSGVPQRRQMTEVQSPHTSGSGTGSAQRGQ